MPRTYIRLGWCMTGHHQHPDKTDGRCPGVVAHASVLGPSLTLVCNCECHQGPTDFDTQIGVVDV